jgi:hypothetical protein
MNQTDPTNMEKTTEVVWRSSESCFPQEEIKKNSTIFTYIFTHIYIYLHIYIWYIYTLHMYALYYIYIDLYDPYSLQVGRAQSSVLQFRLDVVRQPYSQQTIGRGRGQQWSNRLNLGDMISWSSLTSLSQLFTPNYHDRSYLVIQPLLNQL